MGARGFVRTLAVVFVMAAAGCSSSANAPATNGSPLQACSTRSTAPISQVARYHRSAATACSLTPASANPDWPYRATGAACTSDDQCRPDGGIPGHCLQGTCTVDECLTDDDCGAGRLCTCASHEPNAVLLNANACLPGNCRVDSDCGAGGFCMPSSGVCGLTGYFCHTPADTCVDPDVDCPSSCMQACTYFPDHHAFSCLALLHEGC